MSVTPEMIEAVGLLRNFAQLVPRFANPQVSELALAKAIDVLDNGGVFSAIDRDTDYDVTGSGEGVVYGRLPNNLSGPSCADVMFGKLPD